MRLTLRGWVVVYTLALLASFIMGLAFPWEAMPWAGLDLR
jgi:hypothetical protein